MSLVMLRSVRGMPSVNKKLYSLARIQYFSDQFGALFSKLFGKTQGLCRIRQGCHRLAPILL